jgi:cobalt/nickel transport system permease protein
VVGEGLLAGMLAAYPRGEAWYRYHKSLQQRPMATSIHRMTLAVVDPGAISLDRVLALHAPDGFLTVPVALVMWVLTLIVLAISTDRASRTLDERAVPLMGVTAAFIFAAQMVNFPVAGGTSGHLLGGVLAAILLGPWAATLVMACVVAVQALVYQDGGLIVLGANIFNMGVVGTLGGYAIYASLCRVLGGESRARLPAAAAAAWSAVMLGALAMTLELAVSGTSPLEVALPAMLVVHAIIGIGEAVITVGALAFIRAVRPDLLTLRDGGRTQSSVIRASAAAGAPGAPQG